MRRGQDGPEIAGVGVVQCQKHAPQRHFRLKVRLRRPPAEMPVDRARPGGAVELVAGAAEQHDGEAVLPPAGRHGGAHVVHDSEDADDGRRVDRRIDAAFLLAVRVVERDVSAGHGHAHLLAGVREPGYRLDELPHGVRVLRRSEVQAVGDGQGLRAHGADVAVRLGQRLAGALVRVELRVAPVGVGGHRDAPPGLLVDADHPGVVGLGKGRVPADEPVILVGHPARARLIRIGEHAQGMLAQLGRRTGAGEPVRAVGVERVLPLRAGVRPLVRGAFVGDGPRVDVDDPVPVVVDRQPPRGVDGPDDGGLDLPLADDVHERVEPVRGDDGHHPLLRFAHEDFPGRERGVAQKNVLQVHVHAAVAVGGELARGAGDPGRPEVLDSQNEAPGEELEAAFDEDLLHERVAHLHGGPFGGHAVLEGLGGEDRRPADAVAAGARPEEHHLVALAGGVGEVDVAVAQHACAQGVDERILLVGRVEFGLPADVRQPEAVAVSADAGDDAVHNARRVRMADVAEAQLVHDRHGAGAHGDDVAHDAAHAGGRSLIRLDVARVVVRLHLEGDGPAVADVHDAGVLAHAHEQALAHRLRGLLAELAQVDLRGFVRAVLGPHHRVHGELGGRWAPAEDAFDARVFVLFEPELGPGHGLVGARRGFLDGVVAFVAVLGRSHGFSCSEGASGPRRGGVPKCGRWIV